MRNALVVVALSIATLSAQSSDETRRINDAVLVLQEIMAAGDKAVPQSIMEKAAGIAVFPSLLKGGFVVGGQRGHGVLSVRNKKDGTWSATEGESSPTTDRDACERSRGTERSRSRRVAVTFAWTKASKRAAAKASEERAASAAAASKVARAAAAADATAASKAADGEEGSIEEEGSIRTSTRLES